MRVKDSQAQSDSQSSNLSAPSSIFPECLLVATRNPGKVAEIRLLLDDIDFIIQDLTHFPSFSEIEETGATFTENALLKANYYHRLSGQLTLADDSGLEVDALDGAPGINSARYAGPGAADAQRIEKLLRAVDGVPPQKRTARFVCALALIGPHNLRKGFVETCEGHVHHAPIGHHGFGYDPIFEYPPSGKTFAQMTPEEKAAVSHRGKALQQLKRFLIEWHRTDRPHLSSRQS